MVKLSSETRPAFSPVTSISEVPPAFDNRTRGMLAVGVAVWTWTVSKSPASPLISQVTPLAKPVAT